MCQQLVRDGVIFSRRPCGVLCATKRGWLLCSVMMITGAADDDAAAVFV